AGRLPLVDAQNKDKTVACSHAPARKGGAPPGHIETRRGIDGTRRGGGTVATSAGISGTVCVAFDENAGCPLGRGGRLSRTRNGTSRYSGRRRYHRSDHRLAHFARAGQPERRGSLSDTQGDGRNLVLSWGTGSGYLRADCGERQRKAGNAVPEDRKSTRLNSSHVAISY